MATSSIDLQCGPQIKPQDKRLGRGTMEEHSGPHGKRKTTGRSGRPRPTTVKLVPGKNRPHNTRQERLANPAPLDDEAAHCGVLPGEKLSTGTQITVLTFLFPILFISLSQSFFFSVPPSRSSPLPVRHRP